MKRLQNKRGFDRRGEQEAAIALAIAALRFIADEPERAGRFLSLTGIDPQSIRAASQEAGFLLGVLDHVASDERLLLAFANQIEIDPNDVQRARGVLIGSDGDRG